jgi:hypothetical protein
MRRELFSLASCLILCNPITGEVLLTNFKKSVNIARNNKLRLPTHLTNTETCVCEHFNINKFNVISCKKFNTTYEHSTYKHLSKNMLRSFTEVRLYASSAGIGILPFTISQYTTG